MTTGSGTITVITPAAGVRTSMADLITNLRGLCNAGSADYTVNAVDYWTDVQLQSVLDRHYYLVNHEELRPIPRSIAGGSVQYFDYNTPYRFLESTDAGTARFVVQNESGGTVASSGYSVDYPRGVVSFTADTTGLSRYVTGYSYDLNAAAADVWTQKAAHYSVAYDVTTDNHGLRRSQIIANCMTLAKEFGAGSMMQSIGADRDDACNEDY